MKNFPIVNLRINKLPNVLNILIKRRKKMYNT